MGHTSEYNQSKNKNIYNKRMITLCTNSNAWTIRMLDKIKKKNTKSRSMGSSRYKTHLVHELSQSWMTQLYA